MPRGRSRLSSPYYEEYHEHGRADRPDQHRPHPYQNGNVYYPNRNDTKEDMHFGARLGDSQHNYQFTSHMATGSDPGRTMKFMPDPRLQQRIIPYGVNRHVYPSGEIQNYMRNESLLNDKGKYLKPPQSRSCHSSSPHINETPMKYGTALMKETVTEATNKTRRTGGHSIENGLDQFAFGRQESTIVGKSNQSDMNLDSLVHNLLDSLDVTTCKDQSLIVEEQEEDFSTKYASYQRSFDDFEHHAVALPCDPRLHKPTAFSAQAMQCIPTRKDRQPTEQMKPEPRKKITGPERDSLEPANNLKQTLEDIHQRSHVAVPTFPGVPPGKDRNSFERSSQRGTQPNVSSNDQRKSSLQSPDVDDNAGKTRRNVVEAPGSRSSNRPSRNDSPLDGSGRKSAGKSILGSPVWHRQVRMVDNPDNGNRYTREKEMRRVRRLSRSRSRSRSRSPRRSQRYFRHGSPDQGRSRSRSPSSRRARRISPEYPHRRWGAVGPQRNSRSPVGSRDRKGSPSNSAQRSVLERTVIMRRSSRSVSRSPSSSSSQQRRDAGRLKERNEEPTNKPTSNLVVSTNPTAQLFTRNYAVANQIEHVARVGQPRQQVATPTAPRYGVPANPNSLPNPASIIPPVMGYYNQLSQTPVQQQQQQLDMATYQQVHEQQIHQQQFQQHQLLVQQQIQQQLYQRHLQQMSQNSASHHTGPSSSFPASHPAGAVHSAAVPNMAPPQATVSNSAAVAPANSGKGSVEEQRVDLIRDGLLDKLMNLIHQILVVQTQQADLEMKQKTANESEYDSFSVSIMEKAKFRKEMMVSAQALEKIIQKHANPLKEDLSEMKKARLSHRYSYYDPQQHWCELCDVITDKLNDYLTHLHSKEHEERLQSTGVPSTPWHKKQPVVAEEKGAIRIPFNGLPNLQPVKAWYCELCDVWIGDLHCAQLHMTSSAHNARHLKRNMERPDSTLSQTVKKQAALRRHAARKKEEERIRNQQRESDRLKMEAERRDMARKRENELQEKQKRIKQKWQAFVRNEEASHAIELEQEPSAEKDGSNRLPSASSSSTRIRLNIHAPVVSSQSTEPKDATERPIMSLIETSTSTGERVVETADEAAEKPATGSFSIQDPDAKDDDSCEQRHVEDVQMESSLRDTAENLISSVGTGVREVMQENMGTAAFVGGLSVGLPDMSSSSLAEKLPFNIDDPSPKPLPSDGNDVSDQMGLEPAGKHQTDAISNSLVSVPEQVMLVSQTTASPSSPVSVTSKTDGIDTNSSQEHIGLEHIQQVDINVQDHSASSGNTVIESNTEGSLNLEANIENDRNLTAQVEPSENSEMSGGMAASMTAFSQQDSDASKGREKTSGVGEEDGRLLPKVEPSDPDDPTNDCCVILEVNPKLDKIPELIDLESSGEDSDPTTVQSRMSPSGESVEAKCDSVLTDDANRSSTPCSIQFGEFIVLSETREDSCVDTDSRTSTDSSSGTLSKERRLPVEKGPADGSSAS